MNKLKKVLKSIRIAKKSNGRIRFRVLNTNGFIAIRKHKSRGWKIERQNIFLQVHMGKRSIGFEVYDSINNFTGIK